MWRERERETMYVARHKKKKSNKAGKFLFPPGLPFSYFGEGILYILYKQLTEKSKEITTSTKEL